MNIAVIGGGWAGIAAAVELVDRGARVTLFEAGRQLGGRARRARIDGLELDNGQHILLGAYRDTLALMTRIGADPEKLLRRLPLRVEDNRGFCLALPQLPPPFNLAWGLLTARGVSLREKLRTALWMQGLKWRQFKLPADTSVAAWLEGAGQTGTLRRHLWEPLCLAALNTPAEQASAQIFAHVLRDSLGSPAAGATDLLLPRGSLSELIPDPASHWLSTRSARLRTGHRVKRIEPGAAGWQVEGETFAKVIVAVAPQHLRALLPGQDKVPDRFEPIGTVYFHYPAGTTLPYPLRALQGGVGQWLVDRGRGVLAASLSGHGHWENMGDEALALALHQEMQQPGPLPPYRVIREQRATFACLPDLPRPACRTSYPDLFLAGDYTWADYPATLEGAVRSGMAAAAACLEKAARR